MIPNRSRDIVLKEFLFVQLRQPVITSTKKIEIKIFLCKNTGSPYVANRKGKAPRFLIRMVKSYCSPGFKLNERES